MMYVCIYTNIYIYILDQHDVRRQRRGSETFTRLVYTKSCTSPYRFAEVPGCGFRRGSQGVPLA